MAGRILRCAVTESGAVRLSVREEHFEGDVRRCFTLSGEDAELFSRAAEAYITHQLERSFNSLEYYHMMAGKILP